MRIQINGEEREFAQASLTVKDLIEQLSLTPQRIAIEVNRQIIPRSAWERTQLNDSDRVEIVHFVGGGQCRRQTAGGRRQKADGRRSARILVD